MNDLFKSIFGISDSGQNDSRMKENPSDEFRNRFARNGGDDDNDQDDDEDSNKNMIVNHQGGIFGFPLFEDPMGFHDQFKKIVNEMNRAFGMFDIITESDSIQGKANMSSLFNEDLDGEQKTKSLRDLYLKQPDCGCDPVKSKEGFSFNIRTSDIEPGTSNNQNFSVQYSQPKVFSKSVFIQRVVKPDGSIETIETVKDHQGNEKTTITQSSVNEPVFPLKTDSESPEQHPSGISWLKKLFQF